MEVLDAERSKKAWEVAERLGISYRVDAENARFTNPFIARLTETTFDLVRGGLRPRSDEFIAKLATFTVGEWFAEQMGSARIRQEDIDLLLDIIAVVTAILMHARSLGLRPFN
jgi:hypothetical protein